MSYLGRLWQKLIDPGKSYQDSDDRRRAKLLTTILILIFPMIILVGLVIMPAITPSEDYWGSPTVLPASSALIVSIISYILTRLGYFRIGGGCISLYLSVRRTWR